MRPDLQHAWFFPWRSALWLVAAIILIAGCSGTSESDMRRRALRRGSDDEDLSELASTPSAVQGETTAPSQDGGASASSQDGEAGAKSSPGTHPAGLEPNRGLPANVTDKDASQPSNVSGIPEPSPPPIVELTPEEAVAKTVVQLRAIADALERFRGERGFYPAASISRSRQPLLSWRVELLPFLGQEELYRQFRLDQPWDSPANQSLLARIPEVYRLPGTADETCHYLAITGAECAFDPLQCRRASDFEDGVENTVLVVEADQGVPWTKPADYAFDGHHPADGLGILRSGNILVVWGGGKVGKVSREAAGSRAVAMFTLAAGEPFSASEAHRDPDTPDVVAHPTVGGESGEKSADLVSARPTTGQAASSPVPAQVVRRPVPSEAEQQPALSLFRDLYGELYKSTRTTQDRSELAARMLAQVEKTAPDGPAQFVLLNLAGKIAAEAGDVSRARESADLLIKFFELSTLDVKANVVRRIVSASTANGDLLGLAMECAEDAFAEDNYGVAKEMLDAVVTVSKRTNGSVESDDIVRLRRTIDQGERAYATVKLALRELETKPDSGTANQRIGEYYCFAKGDWRRGLPFLINAADAELSAIARQEVDQPVLPESQIALADAWWNCGDKHGSWQRVCRLRAGLWYSRVLRGSNTGTVAVKAEVRMSEIERLYGRQEFGP